MTSPERSDIAPYLDPEYWDGRMVGQPNARALRTPRSFGQQSFANMTVANYLEKHSVPYPLVAFKDGDEIDANDHNPGTIFYGNLEVLQALGPIELDDELTDPRFRAEHPTDMGFELTEYDGNFLRSAKEGRQRAHFIRVDNIAYAAFRSFIIVTRGRRGRNNLQPVAEFGLYRMRDGSIASFSRSDSIDSPLTVGQTLHTQHGRYQHLRRVNTLILSSEARASKTPSFADRLAQISLDPFPHRL